MFGYHIKHRVGVSESGSSSANYFISPRGADLVTCPRPRVTYRYLGPFNTLGHPLAAVTTELPERTLMYTYRYPPNYCRNRVSFLLPYRNGTAHSERGVPALTGKFAITRFFNVASDGLCWDCFMVGHFVCMDFSIIPPPLPAHSIPFNQRFLPLSHIFNLLHCDRVSLHVAEQRP